MENTKENTEKREAAAMELVFVLDKSGSMYELTEDTIGGFNSVLDKQKEAEGEVLVSCVLFSDESEVVYDRVPIGKIEKMTERQYQTGGCTALIDAMGDAIRHISNVHKYARPEDCPEKTLFVIITDGLENASRNWTSDAVKKLVGEKREAGWEFLFLGANIDAVETAKQYGIAAERAVTYKADRKGTRNLYESVGRAAACFRARADIAPDWKADIEEDTARRGK